MVTKTQETTVLNLETWDESNFSFTHILLIILIILNSVGLYLLTGNSIPLPASITTDTFGIKRAILELEYDKVGGKANYDLVSQATRMQMKDQIPQIEQYIKTQWGKTPDTQAPVQAENQTLDAAKMGTILSGAALEGNTLANIVVIEYSDMECPFCIKQYHDTKLQESLKAKYGDKVAFAFKNNKWVNHPGTEAKAIASLCAKKLGGDKAYISVYHTIMDGTQQGNVYPVATLVNAAKKTGVDMLKWQACFDKKETTPEFAAETLEANGFGLGGTPGTLILNVKTWKYATIEGAYPMASFAEKIDALMQ
jgi:protein-disulfide isomerase